MPQKIEEIQNREGVLFISQKTTPLIRKLQARLSAYDYQIFSAPRPPRRLDQLYAVFVFNDRAAAAKLVKTNFNRLIVIFFNDLKSARHLAATVKGGEPKRCKIINCDDADDPPTLTKISWIAFSDTDEVFFNLGKTLKLRFPKPVKKPRRYTLRPQALVKIGLGLFLVFELFFIVPSLLAGLLLYQSFTALKKSDFDRAQKYLTYARPVMATAKVNYRASRPVLSFFYLALLPDNLLAMEETSLNLLDETLTLTNHARRIGELILKTGAPRAEANEIKTRLALVKRLVKKMAKQLILLSQKLDRQRGVSDKFKRQIAAAAENVAVLDKLLAQADVFLGAKGPRRYLLLFQNNMELRPGGGFIGSFGTAAFADYHLDELAIQDVYAADGQLKNHIEPPPAIARHLHQPHWFLRDSNFSPDFRENLTKAEFFLDKELQMKNFDGGIAFTAAAVSTLLAAVGEVYLPDYQETVNSRNFYIKTQTYAEKDFFAGSAQKKNFLASLTRGLMFKLPEASPASLGRALKQALDEKQIVVYLKDGKDDPLAHWSGQVIAPKCLPENAAAGGHCISHNLFPFDANLGVNKANFFVSRLFNLKIKIAQDGRVSHTLSAKFTNDSPGEVFPGGTYKNYFQIYLPRDAAVKTVTKNGTLVEDYQIAAAADLAVLGFYFETPPRQIADIKIVYDLAETIAKGKNIYQLIVQKQIGAANSDLVLELYFHPNIALAKKNFPGLAKNHRLVYNTTLSSDKIFMIELMKE